MTIFNYLPPNNPVVIVLTILYFFSASITTFEIRLTQAKKDGTIPPDEPNPPSWTGIFYWIEWIIQIGLILINWKYGLSLWGIKFILKVLPVLEILGNIFLSPIKKFNKK